MMSDEELAALIAALLDQTGLAATTGQTPVVDTRAVRIAAASAISSLRAELETARAQIRLPGDAIDAALLGEREACAEYLETIVAFFEHGATGPGERSYSVAEIAAFVREWAAAIRARGEK